uniref:Thyroid hormone receptor associated protein 3 n=1 Tax=Macaca nemestrina TaxID=9545 RepID=A0A2K6DUC3_MACNE
SRSVSGSRKCRLSARSGSRSLYWNRDFRGHNRGYRRPYYFRGCNKGFYPWGQYNQGGYGNYHSNWQNYQQAYRSSPSPRSRSHPRNSDKSSSDQSRRSSSSLESSKRKSAREKRSSSKDSWPCQAARDNQGDEAKEQTFSGGTSQDTKASESSKPWPDATYGTGSASGVSAVSELTPPVCGGEAAVTPSYPLPKPSAPLSSTSQMSSTLLSGAEYQPGTHQGQFNHGSWVPESIQKENSPSIGSTYVSSQKQESAAPGGAAYTKRYLEKKDKEQKQTNTDKEKIKEKGSFSDTGLGDGKMKSDSFAPKTDSENQSRKRCKHRDDFEKQMADFHKEEMDDEVIDANKNQEEEKSGKGKQRKTEEMDEESFPERSKKEDWGKRTEVTAYKAVQEKSSSPPPRKTSESQDKLEVKDFSTGKSSFSITREAQVNVQMDSFDEDLAGPSGLLAQEHKLCRDLVHSNKKEQEFCSTFQHIQSAQSQRSPSELFAQHIVTIVHHVKEHHFGSSGMTLHECFTKYLKRGTEQEAAKNKNRPEIHRRIDAEGKYKDDPVDRSLDIERRKRFLFSFFLDGVTLCRPDSSPSRDSSAEKTEKTHKGSKKQKKHRRARDRSRSSSSSSQSSHSYKAEEYTEETEEREESTTGFEKSRLGTKGLVGGRTGGTFPFRARGRGWCRGSYSGNNNNNSNNFQKRNREEEWYPEYTPKSKKYYLHDDHEGEGSEKWEPFLGIGSCSRSRNQVPAPRWPRTSSVGEEREIEDDEKEKDNLQPTTE